MFASRRPIRTGIPFTALPLVCACLLGSLISSCGLGADGERSTVPNPGNPEGGKSDSAGSLVLTAPAAGAQVKVDSGIRIAWKSTGKVGDMIRFDLYRDTVMVWDIGIMVPTDSGEYFWSLVPEWLPSGDGYHFRIYSTPNIGQMGPAFTLILPALYGTYEFLRPQAGDVWMAGGTGEVAWHVTGNPGSYSGLTLWKDSPRELVTGWTPGSTQDFSGPFNVPADLAGGTYRMRVGSQADTTLFAFSEPFTIQAAAPQ